MEEIYDDNSWKHKRKLKIPFVDYLSFLEFGFAISVNIKGRERLLLVCFKQKKIHSIKVVMNWADQTGAGGGPHVLR